MQIGNLHDVQAIILNPLTGGPELTHPDDFGPLLESYGQLHYLGAVGTDRTECATMHGLFVHEQPRVVALPGRVLPDTLQRQLLDEYATLTHDAL